MQTLIAVWPLIKYVGTWMLIFTAIYIAFSLISQQNTHEQDSQNH